MLGLRAIGMAPLGAPRVQIDRGLEILVAGVSRGDPLRIPSVVVTDRIAARSTATTGFFDSDSTFQPLAGERVDIRLYGFTLFSGLIHEVDMEAPDIGTSRFITIQAVDWAALFDRYHVTNSYNEKTLREIVTDIVNLQTGLSADGVTLGEVVEGPILTKATFNLASVTNCFRDLAEASGLAWNINVFKVISFFPREKYEAPFTVGDANQAYHSESMSYSRSLDDYRNTQWIRAGNELTDILVESVRGDSATIEPEKRKRTFNLAFPVGEMISITRGGVTQRLGVKGVEDDGDLTLPTPTTWPQWFYQKSEHEISQNSEEDEVLNPTLTANERLEVTYRGQFPILLKSEDGSEIAARQAIEGGTGVYENIEEDEKVEGSDQAARKAQRLLQLYGRIPRKLNYSIDRMGLAAGHVQTISRAAFGLSAIQFLVDSVRLSILDTRPRYTLRCSVESLDGERQEGWVDFYRDLAERGRKFTIRENEAIVISKIFLEQIAFTDALTDSENDSATLAAVLDDPYSNALMGDFTVPVSGRLVARAVMGRSIMGDPYGS